MITEQEARDLLNAEINRAGSQTKWADLHGFSQPFVSDMARGNRRIPEQVLEILGLRRISGYERVS